MVGTLKYICFSINTPYYIHGITHYYINGEIDMDEIHEEIESFQRKIRQLEKQIEEAQQLINDLYEIMDERGLL